VARHKKRAADLGAWVCFEDEAGQGLRPPKGRTWGRRGRTPVVKVTAQGTKRVSMAALICTKAGRRPRLIYRIHQDRGLAKGQRKGFTETDYARLLDAAHQQLGGPVVLVWDNCETRGAPSAAKGLTRGTTGPGCLVQDLSARGPGRCCCRRTGGRVPIGALPHKAPSQF
jgi:hypothetical protein